MGPQSRPLFFVRMELQLLESDVRSRTWKKLEAALADELSKLRQRNDSPHLQELQTAAIRARIALIKELLSLAEKASDSRDGPHTFDEEESVPLRALTG